MSKGHLVVVEDESDILEVIEYNLVREDFDVSTARDGKQGLKLIQRHTPDLVILDLMLPGLDGLEICRTLRADSATKKIPVIMVTAKGEESDIVLGLGIGADDYVTKPFSPKELVARVNAVLRRNQQKQEEFSSEIIVSGPLSINTGKHQVKLAGHGVTLTATEFRILHVMASRPGQVFTREQLIKHSTVNQVVIIDRNIDVHIRAIRKALGDHQDLIETVKGVGYRFADNPP